MIEAIGEHAILSVRLQVNSLLRLLLFFVFFSSFLGLLLIVPYCVFLVVFKIYCFIIKLHIVIADSLPIKIELFL
jgi:hypothetical protein